MKIHEYQATELFQKAGVAVVSGHVATDAREALRIAERIGYPVVLKSQVLVGGRGKAGGIKKANTSRLNSVGVHTVLDFYHAPLSTIKSAFHSINAYYWHLRLRGWEIDDVEFKRHSFGAMYSIPKPLFTPEELSPILHKLVEKTVSRMRNSGYSARGIHVALLYKNRAFWHHGKTISEFLFTQPDIYKVAYKIMTSSPYSYPVANLAVSVFDLQKLNSTQLDLFNTVLKKVNLADAIDHLKEKWGDYIITPAMMLGTGDAVPDRIGFGNIKDLENFVTSE